jgi:hypothetical protein
MAGQKPMWKAQAGAVSVALWENQAMVGGRSMRLLKATVERRYKDGEEWKSSGSFGRNDIPLVLWCLSKAFGVMLEKAQDDNGEDAPVA